MTARTKILCVAAVFSALLLAGCENANRQGADSSALENTATLESAPANDIQATNDRGNSDQSKSDQGADNAALANTATAESAPTGDAHGTDDASPHDQSKIDQGANSAAPATTMAESTPTGDAHTVSDVSRDNQSKGEQDNNDLGNKAQAKNDPTDDDHNDAEADADNGQKGETISVHLVSWRDIPFQTVKHQAFDYSCGSAAVATLLTYTYGQPTTEKAVFKEMFARGNQNKIRREGFSMLDMSHYLNARGLEAQGYKITDDAITHYRVPFIALVNNRGYNHFVVVKTERDGHVLIGDPNTGNTDYTREEFDKIWGGVALIVTNRVSKARQAYNDPNEWRFIRAHASLRNGNDLANDEAVLTPTDWQIAPIGFDLLPAASVGSIVSLPNNVGGTP